MKTDTVRRRQIGTTLLFHQHSYYAHRYHSYFVNTSTPCAVTSSVCSYCAHRSPSAVTAVQPSDHTTTSG